MARAGRPGFQFVEGESPRQDEVRRRIRQFGGGQKKADRDKEKEEEKLEKARAAAWAWYQHGKGGKESVSSSTTSGGGAAMLTPRSPGEIGHKSSRFKTEALKTSRQSISQPAESDQERGEPSHHRRTDSGWNWDFSNESQIVVSPSSSLFDSYELDSMSKRIDTAFHGPTLATRTTRLITTSRPDFFEIVPHGEGPSEISRPAIGLPPPMRPPGASAAPHVPRSVTTQQQLQVVTIPPQEVGIPQGSPDSTRARKVTRTSSSRMKYLGCSCASMPDAMTREDITHALGIDITKCDCQMTPGDESDVSCLHLSRITRAIQDFMHLPDFDYHPQRQHHERRHLRLHLHNLHRPRDNEYHHYLHYQIKLRDGVHHVRRAFGRRVERSVAYWCFI